MITKIYVENLPRETTEHELAGVFSAYGDVEEVNIAFDEGPPLFGSVRMATAEGAQAAIPALNGKMLGNAKLAVCEWWSGRSPDLSEWRKWATPPDELPGVLSCFGMRKAQ
jgi:RNA recognition motif-containing protein